MIQGNLTGIRESVLNELEKLYDAEFERDVFLPDRLLNILVKYTQMINREMLVYLGYLDAQYMTGLYGPSTIQAVTLFQEDTGKVPTGIANHHTQLTLQQMYHDSYWSNDLNFQVSE